MFRRRRTFVIGVPLLLVSALAAVTIWGQLQPRPPGYAVTAAADTLAPSAPNQIAAEPTSEPNVEPTAEPTPTATRHTLDARDKSEWAFFDLDAGRVVSATFEDLDWDLAFRRTKLVTNGGITNPDGVVGAVDLGRSELETAVPPGSPDFTVDALGGDDGDDPQNAAISRWYNYDVIRHVIVARDDVYLVRTSDGGAALIQFDSYYCEDDSPGCVTFRYRLLPDSERGAQR